jgi:hypothetical protein
MIEGGDVLSEIWPSKNPTNFLFFKKIPLLKIKLLHPILVF